VPAAPDLTDENTNRDERSTELYVRDAVSLAPDWRLWLGLRHSRLDRESVRTDGSRPTQYRQSFTTPWLALSWQAAPRTTVYASAGQGVESEVVPNRARYTNRGQALPALKSRQLEAGIKHDGERTDWSLVAFDIRRPLAQDRCTGDGDTLICTRVADDDARHSGLEASAAHRAGAWTVQGSATWLQARLARSGLVPTNVPERSARVQLMHDVAQWPGLQLQAAVIAEGPRVATPDDTVAIPGWSRIDLGARWRQTLQGTMLTWRAGLDNATDRRAWRESPYQFGHAYLFPLAPRTWRMSVQADL
jgi:iron complex outermembrane receptor protein